MRLWVLQGVEAAKAVEGKVTYLRLYWVRAALFHA